MTARRALAAGRAALPLPGFGPSVAAQLRAALELTLTKRGHLPDCGHGLWMCGWSIRTRHPCDVEGCDRTGQPCSPRCRAVRAALALEIA